MQKMHLCNRKLHESILLNSKVLETLRILHVFIMHIVEIVKVDKLQKTLAIKKQNYR